MANLQYIGARYVPIIYTNPDDGTANWKSGVSYEALTIVTVNGNSYTSKKAVPDGIGTPQDNPEYWVQTGNFNASLVSLQSRVSSLETQNGSEALETEAQTLSGAVNELVSADDNMESDIADITSDIIGMNSKKCIGCLLLNHFYNFSEFAYAPQGACYIGDDKIVQYYNNTGANNGYLICFNIKTCTEEWRYLVDCYHGNSITYNPNTEMLYISGCKTYDDTYINRIFEININTPDTINRTIMLPNTTINYSLAYDIDKDLFYAINNIGTTPGSSDILTIYNNALNEVVSQIQLENYPAVTRSFSVQGCQLAINGIAYILVYSNPAYIVGYDVSTGKEVQFFNLPTLINDYRSYTEAESLMYDYINKRMFVSARSSSTDLALRSYQAVNIFEIDAFHGIPYYEATPSQLNNLQGNANVFFVAMNITSLQPRHLVSHSSLNTAKDGVNLAYKYQGCRLQFGGTRDTDEIYDLHCSGVNVRIQAETNNILKINKLNCINSKLYIQYAEFMDNDEWTSGGQAQLALTSCDAFLANCTFKDNNPSSLATIAHIVLFNGSNLMSRNTSFQGTYPNAVRQYYSMYNGVYVES